MAKREITTEAGRRGKQNRKIDARDKQQERRVNNKIRVVIRRKPGDKPPKSISTTAKNSKGKIFDHEKKETRRTQGGRLIIGKKVVETKKKHPKTGKMVHKKLNPETKRMKTVVKKKK